MIVKELMKKPLVIDKNLDLKDVANLMEKNDVSSLIIISEDKIKGIITQEDLVENFDSDKKVFEVMSKKVIVVGQNEDVESAIEIIRENNISVLPVLDDKEQLIGVISVKDIMGESENQNDFLMN